MNFISLLFYITLCLSSHRILAVSDACKYTNDCTESERSERRLNDLLSKREAVPNKDHSHNHKYNYDYDENSHQESIDDLSSEKSEKRSQVYDSISEASPTHEYGPVGSSTFMNTIRHYHGDNLYKNFQRGRQVDAARANQIEQQVMREYAGSSISDPEVIALMQKANLMAQAAEHYKAQKERRNKLRDELSEEQPYYQPRKELIDTATEALNTSRDYYRNEDIEEGAIAGAFADALLDLATSFTPGVSWGRDVYEAITGLDLLNGEELGTFGRSMSILGSVTFGLGSKIGKGFKVLGRLIKGGDKAEEALKTGKKIYSSVEKTRDFVRSELKVSKSKPPSLKSVKDRLSYRGEPNSIISGSDVARKGGGKRAFITDSDGKIIAEITPQRTKIRDENIATDGKIFEVFIKAGEPTAIEWEILNKID